MPMMSNRGRGRLGFSALGLLCLTFPMFPSDWLCHLGLMQALNLAQDDEGGHKDSRAVCLSVCVCFYSVCVCVCVCVCVYVC